MNFHGLHQEPDPFQYVNENIIFNIMVIGVVGYLKVMI